MARTKKVEEESVSEMTAGDVIINTSVGVAATSKVSELTSDFGREDLNALRDKVNELVRLINSL